MATELMAVQSGLSHLAVGLKWSQFRDRDISHQALVRVSLATQCPGQNSGGVSSLGEDALRVGTMRGVQAAVEPHGQWAGVSREISRILEAFVNTCRRWRLEPRDQVVLLGLVADEPIGMGILSGRVLPFSRDVDDRAAYVVAISIGLGILLEEDAEAENRWLRLPRAGFGECSPLEFMLDGSMSNLIEVNDLVKRERGF